MIIKDIAKIFDTIADEKDSLEDLFKEMNIKGRLDQRTMVRIIILLCKRIDALENK